MIRPKINFSFFVLVIAMLVSKYSIANENILAIDAGHSKLRPGATSASGKTEFEFNSALAVTISDFLLTQGISVVRIGFDGNMINLKERTRIANKEKANFLLSVHHDSVQSQFLKQWKSKGVSRKYSDYASGFSLFVSRKNSQLEKSLQCAIAMGAALKENGFRFSPHHADKIHGENREWANKENGVYYYDDLVVLKTATMPAVLLEAGVIINRKEEQKIQNKDIQKNIAKAIEQGLINCKLIKPNLPKSPL